VPEAGPPLSFDEVRSYLNDARTSQVASGGAGGLGAFTLADLRRQFQGNATELEAMKTEMMRKLEAERIAELQSLKAASSSASAARRADSEALVAKTKQLEATRHRELRARIEHHRVNQVLQSMMRVTCCFPFLLHSRLGRPR
jgi:hypothetical protein